jgi:Ca-activated chloride channel family protein
MTPTPQPAAQGLTLQMTPLKAAVCDAPGLKLDVLLRVQALGDAPTQRTPLSIALVIDRSGSMAHGKLHAAKACAQDLVARLHPQDEVCLVVYDDEVQVPLPLTSVALARHSIEAVLACIDSGGSTDLHGGWIAGAQQLAPRTGQGRMCRVILLSDGQANHGVTSEDEISQQVRMLAQSGVTTTTVGIGSGFNESLMTAMAVAGQGNAHYGDRAEDLAEPFDAELGLLAHLAWRDVKVQIGSATSRWELLNDYASTGNGQWSLPSIPANAEAWACFSVRMSSAVSAQTRSRQGKALHVTVTARDAYGSEHQFVASLAALPMVDAPTWAQMPADELVARRLVELESARLQRSVRQAVQQRDWPQAQQLLNQVKALAVDHPWIQEAVEQLEDLLSRRDHERMEKELAYASFSMSRRVAEIGESGAFSMRMEASKPAYLRRKSLQGRSSKP